MYSPIETMGVVETSLGKIKGSSQRSKFGKSYFSFKGIPYAQPPLGDLRFAKPVPIAPWTNILDLSRNKESPACWQVNPLFPESDSRFLMKGQEDCLYLNVFTHKLPEEDVQSLPVIFWIHGGAFTVESNDSRMYGPDLLLEHDVVLVTINYRLGPFGFLALGNEAGNQGMHDQVTALKWVQSHISAFGGDPQNVTIMGESAGGMSCMLHLVSPLSQGLFHKVIALSGAGSTPFLHNDRKPQHYARAAAKKFVGAEDYTDEELLAKLRSVPAKKIATLPTMFKDWDSTLPVCFKPCLDPQDGDEAFMPIPFVQAVQEGKVNTQIPVFTGCCSHEGLILSVPFRKHSNRWIPFFKDWNKWAAHLFFNREAELLSDEDREKSLKIRDKFFPQVTNHNLVPPKNDSNHQALEQCLSTSIWHAPMINDAKMLAERGSQVFVYEFSYRGTMTLADVFRLSLIKMGMNFGARHVGLKLFQKDLGVCHGDDMFFYFTCKPFGMPPGLKTDTDKKVSQVFLNFVTSFAAHGHPGSQEDQEWKALNTSEELQIMTIDKSLSFGPISADRLDKVQFWLDEVQPNEKGHAWSDQPVGILHEKIATKR